jgi:uncharacterized protein YbjT (DUF2867 family)
MLVRNPERAPELPDATPVQGDFGDHDAVLRGLDGARTVFMVSASESPDRLLQHKTFVDAAAEAGVEHLVYLSFFGAAPDATFTLARDHFHTEKHIRARPGTDVPRSSRRTTSPTPPPPYCPARPSTPAASTT